MKQWAEVDLPPGQFFGSTGVQTLTPQELGIEDRRFQAWAKKVEFCGVVWMRLEFCGEVWMGLYISISHSILCLLVTLCAVCVVFR